MKRMPLSRRALSGILIALLLGGVIAWIAASRRDSEMLFQDSFSLGKADEWKSLGGTWQITDGGMRDDSDERGAKLITGKPKWADYSIEGDLLLRSVAGYASDAGFIMRTSEEEEGVYAYNGYFALLHTVRNEGGSLLLGRSGHGPAVMASILLPGGVKTQTWYHMKLLAVGCSFVAAVRELSEQRSWTVHADDPECLLRGRAGLQSSHSGGVWRNINIKRATARDKETMLASSLTSMSGLSSPHSSVVVSPPQSFVSPPSAANSVLRQPVIPISEARLDSLVGSRELVVSGQVVLTSPVLFVQDASGGLQVEPSRSDKQADLKIGDEVTVAGVVSNGTDPVMKDATIHLLWEGTPMPAISVTASRIATGVYDSTFIEVQCLLDGSQQLPPHTIALQCKDESQSFLALIPSPSAEGFLLGLQRGSLVRLRGVATHASRFGYRGMPFVLLARSTDDVRLVAGPPWWRGANVVRLVLAAALVLIFANILYHRIQNWKLRAVMEERERLAYEMHDTLAQSVAGIGFQLEAIRASIPETDTELKKQLRLAYELVQHSHGEARRTVDILRQQDLQNQGLLTALKQSAMRLLAGTHVRVVAEARGTERPITLRCADALFRIGQEAIANAVRHADPETLELLLDFQRTQIVLSVHDDGRGFEQPAEVQTLGLLGMHKRAEAVAAHLTIASARGAGTTVTVILSNRPSTIWSTLQELLRRKQNEYVLG